MTLWAVIPTKDPARAKTRLARIFTPEQRRVVSLGLLERTLRVLRETPAVAHCLVVSPAAEPLSLARHYGAHLLEQAVRAPSAPRDPRRLERSGAIEDELNAALEQAARAATAQGAEALLVLPADLPCLTAAALTALIARAPGTPGIVLAPDRHRTGTNAVLVMPPTALPFSFGRDSFARHRDVAGRTGLAIAICDHPAFALDLDEPDDVEALTGLTMDGERDERERAGATRLIEAILAAGDRYAATEHCA